MVYCGMCWRCVDLFASERYEEILKRLKEKGAVTTSELVTLLDVSAETVRRDLLELERIGKLQRVYGGAIPLEDMKPIADLSHRLEDNCDGKAELSRTACRLVNDGDVIFIDAGSTAVFFAGEIKNRFSDLTVITHSIDVFDIVKKNNGFKVILCGGTFMSDENAFYGKLTMDVLCNLHVNKAFIFPSAVSHKFGIRDYNQELSQIQQCAIKIADEIIILADSNKFEKKALLKIAEMNCGFKYVTDSKLNESFGRIYAESGIKIIS